MLLFPAQECISHKDNKIQSITTHFHKSHYFLLIYFYPVHHPKFCLILNIKITTLHKFIFKSYYEFLKEIKAKNAKWS